MTVWELLLTVGELLLHLAFYLIMFAIAIAGIVVISNNTVKYQY